MASTQQLYNNNIPALITKPQPRSLVPTSPSAQDKIKALQSKDIAPTLAGALMAVSSIKAAQDLRTAAAANSTPKSSSGTSPVSGIRIA